MNNLVMLTSVTDKTEEVMAFFSRDNLTVIFNQFLSWATNMILQLILAFIIWKIGKFAMKWLVKLVNKALEKGGFDESVRKFIVSIVKVAVYAVMALVILDILGLETASLIAVFGSAALAISMSLQGSLSNLAGGILILLFRPFKIGDYIVANSCEGTVVSIEILYTKLRTGDNKLIMMPNGALSNSNIINVGAEGIRRLDIQVGIAYGSDVTKAKNILRNILENYPTVDKEKEVTVIVKELSDSCVLLETRVWVTQDTYWDTRFVLLEKYKKEFDANDIEIPYNTIDVNIRQ